MHACRTGDAAARAAVDAGAVRRTVDGGRNGSTSATGRRTTPGGPGVGGTTVAGPRGPLAITSIRTRGSDPS
ncbi:hypothetical protein F750_6266 [Streptomyces sp. PAMC 26508]|nr:hypothetical protein F750_6266 [Streptomyces sp. PAMC 26508]